MRINFFNFDWDSEQGVRLQEYLHHIEKELDNHQLDETLNDFIDYEEEEGEMSFDTFKSRLEVRN